MMKPSVTVVGSLNMDLIVRSPRIPQPGETIIGSGFHTAPGGKGANQAVAAARLGAQVTMVGCVGEDAFASTLLGNLNADGVDHTYVIHDPDSATGVALIVVDDAGQNSIVVASGANMKITPDDVIDSKAVIVSADVLLLQLEVPDDVVFAAARVARESDVTVVLNPAPARTLPPDLLKLVDVLIPNETETGLLTDMPVDNQADIETAASALLDLGVNAVIMTLGSRGALLVQQGTTQVYPTFKVDPVDTTAAGDAFVGGFSVALANGGSIEEAIRWGNAAGALATTKLGAQPSLPSHQDVLDLLSK
jgi:ribokinase